MTREALRVAQQGFPFWGGPAHGEYKALAQGNTAICLVPVPVPLYLFDTNPDPSGVAIETVTYTAYEFRWPWEQEWHSGQAMVSGQGWDVYQLEVVLQVLGTLWGQPDYYRNRRWEWLQTYK